MAVTEYPVFHQPQTIMKLFYTWNKHSEEIVAHDIPI